MKCGLIVQSCLIYNGCVLDLPHYACYSVVYMTSPIQTLFSQSKILNTFPRTAVSQQASYCILTRILTKSITNTVSWYTDYSLVNAMRTSSLTSVFYPGENKAYIKHETLITMNNFSRIRFYKYCMLRHDGIF